MAIIYIHYGATEYNPNLFQSIHNNQHLLNKPIGGLWASPINANYGWKDWCKDVNFRDCSEENSFKFQLSDTANILTINTKAQCLGLPTLESPLPFHPPWILPDFEKLLEQGIDAIQLNISTDYRLYWKFYGWDCDSILIMNKDIIKII